MAKGVKKKRGIISKGKKMAKPKRPRKVYRAPNAADVTTSKIETIFGIFLKDLGLDAQPQFQIGFKFFDFHIKGTNILIEFDGDYWHCNPDKYPTGPEDKTQVNAVLNDKYKNKLAAANGYKLIRIWESEFKEGPGEVAKKIKKILKENA